MAWRPRYFTLWSGQAISYFGSSVVQFALVWWLTQESDGSATVLAVATMSALLPQIVLGPFAGVLVDRWSRGSIMVVADLVAGLVALLLVVLFVAGAIEIWHVYAAMALRSTVGAFQYSAMTASTSLMVPAAHLARISGLNQALGGVLGITAPPMGALLMSTLPMEGVLLFEVVTMLFGVVPLIFIAVPRPAKAPNTGRSTTFFAEFAAGLNYVWRWPGMVTLLAMICAINFVMMPPSALLPVLVAKHFDGNALHLASLQSTFGFGVLAGGLALVGWGLAAVMSAFTNGPLIAVLQTKTAPEMQGRLLSVVNSLASSMAPLSLAVAGPLADAIGVRAVFALSGTVCAVLGVAGFFMRPLSRFEDGAPAR